MQLTLIHVKADQWCISFYTFISLIRFLL